MVIAKNKFLMKVYFAFSILLLIPCVLLLMGTIVKLLYYQPIIPFRALAAKAYNSHELIQNIWAISPKLSFDLSQTENYHFLLILLGIRVGISFFRRGLRIRKKLSKALDNVKAKELEDEYRDQRNRKD